MQQANQPQPFGAPQPTGVNQPPSQAQQFGLPGPFAQYPPYAAPTPYAAPVPYGVPTPYAAPVPYGQPFGQQLGLPDLYAQPQPQPAPFAQAPYAQAPAAQLPFTQAPMPQAPMAQAPTPQAAPVPPVAFPAGVGGPGAGGPGVGGAGAPSAPQNPYARQLVPIARMLEQSIPGYQILMSVLGGLGDSPRAESLGIKTPLDLLRDLSHQLFCALGAIRRMLMGELTSEAMMGLALATGRLERIHTLLRAEMERLVMGAPPELRAPLSGLNQTFANAGALNAQALAGVQSLVGPQVWEAAKNKGTEARA